LQSRRTFLANSLLATGALCLDIRTPIQSEHLIMTVQGTVSSGSLGLSLTHEHILVDFIGADQVSRDRYNRAEVRQVALSYLNDLKALKCESFFDCTPAYLGRDVELLKQLAKDSSINIITNTGYYGAAKEKYLPKHAYTETDEQLSQRWIKEWEEGIDGTGIKPGFIKTGVDSAPLTEVQEKLIHAAALTHLATGLTIAVHTGEGKAAMREMEILLQHGVSPNAWIWVHAQNEKNPALHYEAASKGGWVEYDGASASTLKDTIEFISRMKREGYIKNILISQDSGWYHVGEPNGGEFRNFNFVFAQLIPEMKKQGFSQKEINQIFIANPSRAFSFYVRRS